jgi:hypothetical protein
LATDIGPSVEASFVAAFPEWRGPRCSPRKDATRQPATLSLGNEVRAVARDHDFVDAKNAEFSSEKEMAKPKR